MAAARESFLVKLLLFISCSSIAVVTCQSQGFTCFSSTDCHGNKVDRNISVIAECCAIDAGLSFKENAGDCGNCFTDEKFESQGDEFYLSIFSNYEPSEYFRIGKLRLAVEPVGREMTTFMVDALGAQTVYTAPKEVSMDSGLLDLESVSTRDKAIFVKSEAGDPLSVVAYVEEFQSSDTFKVFPCVAQPVAAYEYYAVSVPQSFIVLPTDPDYLDYEDVLDPQGNSAIVIVTTEENTVLNVTLTQNVSISGASDIVGQIGTDSLRSDEQVSFQLSARGSTLYLASLDDLTGSRVVSNKPIAFITGHECGTLPHNIQYCDHLVEQITPTSTWGRQFIISTIATRKDFDTFRIIASRSDTSVSVACTITDVPPLNLNTDGSFIEFHINSTDSCYLESNQPILLAQFSVSSLVDRVFNSDPFLVIIPPVEQYRSSYVFNTFTGTRSLFRSGQNYINILLPAGVGHEGLRLDEQPLSDDASVTSILCTSSDTVCATTVQLTVSDDRHNLNHIDDGAQFSAIVYWLSYRVAHGYSVGMTQNPIALPSVSLQTSKFVVFENESVVAILLTRTGDTSVPATVFVSAAEISDGGNALSGEDFVAVSQTAVEFGPNEHLVTVMIDIVDDVFPENTEEFEVFLSTSPGVYIVSPAYANVTILNDDPPLPVMNVSFAETTIEVMEGIGLVTFTLEKTMGALGPVAVRIFTTSGSAVDGDDFVAIDDVITFEIEDLQATIFTLVLDNLSLEGVEEFTAHIEPVVGDFPVAVQNSSATVSIRDNDVVVLGFEQPTYTVSEENDQLVVSVSISHGSLERSVVATVETISGSAVDNDDFVPVTRVLSFDSFTTEQSITISIINDNQVEVNEEFNIRVVTEEEDSSNIIVSPDEAVVTIVDTDRVEIDLLPIATTVREGEGSARVNVSVMEGRLGGPVSIDLTTFNINTTGGVDYTEVSTEITLSLSNSFQEVLIPISDDTVYDGPEDEKFLITATIKSGQNTDRIDVPISSQTITIVDNEPRPIAFVQFSETSYTTVENAQEIVLLVESDGINYDLFTVDYTYQSGEAQDGSDIILPNGSLQFPPGSTTAAITVPIIDDGVAELAETFTVQLASRDAILMTDSTTVTIIDNDVVNVGFGQMVYSVTEEQNAEVVLTIAKTTLTDRTVSVMFSTLDGTALAGVDYEQLNQVLTFSPNENTREVTVRILNNEIQEPGSRLFFGQLRSLSSSDVNISLPTASILVVDDDQSNIPSRPLNFEASPQATAVEFTWNQPSIDTIDNYVLMWTYLSPCERGSPQSVLLDGTARQYILEGLEENSSYSFRLQARNSAGVGPEALQVVTTHTAAPSGTPQSLRSVSTTPTSITVEWSDINCLDQNGAITSYDVRVNGRVALTTSQTQATITGLTSSTAHFIDVRGNNSIGGGPFSPTSVIMTAGAENVTIGFDRNVYFVTEGEAAVLSVVLSEPVSVPITIGVSTIDGTAEESEDYVFSDVIVTFSAGETLQLISILTVDDNIGESNETFGVVFSSLPPNNINIGTFPFSTIFITDDDERFAVECIQTSVGPSGPIQIACIPMNGEVESVQCDYNNGLRDEPCGLGITLNLNQFEPGPLSLTITVTSTEGDLTTLVFTYTVPEPLSLNCSLSAVSGRVTVSCNTSRDLFLPPLCNLTGFGVIEPCDLDNIELNVVDLPPGPYNLTIFVVDVMELTATETIGLFLSEPLFNAACVLNGSVAMCMSSLDGTLVPVLYECSYDGGDRQPCEPPFSTTDESLETGPHILIIFASTPGGQTQAIELPFIVPDINECIMGTDDCVDDATCVNTVGSFTCMCPSGFGGNGRAGPVGSGCADINECTMGTDDCVDDATCINTAGSFTCTCPSFFSGDGRASGTGCRVTGSQPDEDELVECYTDSNCFQDATFVLMTRRECCVMNENRFSFRSSEAGEPCNACVVFGFFQSTFTASEQGLGYALSVGYLKRPQTNVVALGFMVNEELLGTTTMGDFTLQTTAVAVLPNQANRQVTFTFHVDSIAQELDETVRLQLTVSQSVLNRFAGEFNNNVFFLDTADLVIVDANSLSLQFTNEDYRASEAELLLPVRVTKSNRIRLATPVTVRVIPSTLTQHRTFSGRPDPPGTLDDDPNSPIEADSNDFDNSTIVVTFQPDETGRLIIDVDTPVRIVDDVINEAYEQNFVVTVEVVDAFNTSRITIEREDSLCRIIDDDDNIAIGFQQLSYTFSEPTEPSEDILGVVILEKENGVISEQTFRIVVTVTPTTPSQSIRPAELSMDGADNDYTIGRENFVNLELEPDQQTISFDFRLFADDIAEETEAFQATPARREDSPEFLVPMVLSPNTFIIIEDDDRIFIGFERNYTVDEFIGMVDVCAVVTFPAPNVPILPEIVLSVNTIEGTADETDYGRIAESDFSAFLQFNDMNRRQCATLMIVNDEALENTESLTIDLVFSSLFTPPSGVILDPNVTTVVILDDDEDLVECFTDGNCLSETTPLLMTRRECCVDTPAAVGFREVGFETCVICVVFGFFQSTFTAAEQGQGYALSVGYLKRPQTSVVALSFMVNEELLGTTTMSDFILQTTVVAVLPNQASRQVTFTFHVDSIAQELDETVRLRLTVSQSVLNRFDVQFDNSVFFLDTADLVIVDSDILVLQFTNDDYRSSEPELSLPVKVTKSNRIATPVTVSVTPVTLRQHRTTGRPDPRGTLDDSQRSPIEADLNDFENSMIVVTFQPDETGMQMDDVDTPVTIVNDDVNEADEQNFVVTVEVVNAFNTSRITIEREDSLCRIIDDDEIAIGFQQSSYTFSEPPEPDGEAAIVGVVLLEKENGVISEQTFRIFVIFTGNTPDPRIPAADSSSLESTNDYRVPGFINFAVVNFDPNQQRIPINFLLFGDDLYEGTEAFQLVSEGTPEFSGPTVLSPSTFIIIEDNDECEPLGAVRLVGGSNAMEGRVEVCDGVVWGTVCDDVWDNQDAMVVCRQLGFPAQGAIARDGALFGEGSGPIVLDNVQCSGSESMILNCTANDIGVHNCDHSEDAGVTCQPSSPSPSPTPPDELVECYTDSNCQEDATFVLMTRRECCVMSPNTFSFRLEGTVTCNICVVFGFFQSTFTAPEQGQGYAIPVGYLKRPEAGVVALVFTVNQELLGTTTISDFTLQTTAVAVLPNQANRQVTFTFHVDSIAQELDETVRLRLTVSQSVLNRFAGQFDNSVFFLDTTDLVIVNSDTLVLRFTNDDYRSFESDLLLPVRVTKNQRIATPVTVRVTPITLTQHRTTGRPDPSGIPPDNQFSPIEADFNDFDNSVIVVTFQADETGRQMNDVDTPVSIVNDTINEAEEQNFVVTLDVVSATDVSSLTISRKDALCRIIDDDDISIGFERSSYTFPEPSGPEEVPVTPIVDEIFIAKENGVVSEQTFRIAITVTRNTPDQNTQPADPRMGDIFNDYEIPGGSNFVLEIEPQEQQIPFNLRLFGDDIAEGTEAFQVFTAAQQDSPTFLGPTFFSPNTFIIIEDDDIVSIGFERNYSVDESVGMVNVCAVVTFPAPDVPILSTSILSVNTMEGTADEMDYVRIAESDGLVFLTFDDENRRQCFFLEITDDGLVEDTESLTIDLVFSSFLSSPSGVLLDPNVTTVQILDNDAFIVIGWESPVYNVNEDSGQVEICAVITTPPSDVELEFDDLLLLVSTEDISAVENLDYNPLAGEVLGPFGNQSRLGCVTVNIIDDINPELSEAFNGMLEVVPGTGPPPELVTVRPNTTAINIVDNDGTPPSCSDGDVRLRDGGNELEGRVEVCFDGEWGTVCDDSWDDDDAAVVCRQLGFSDQGALAIGDGFFGQGEDSILLDEVQCVGNETRLIDCPRANDMMIGQHDCIHFEDAGVECQAN